MNVYKISIFFFLYLNTNFQTAVNLDKPFKKPRSASSQVPVITATHTHTQSNRSGNTSHKGESKSHIFSLCPPPVAPVNGFKSPFLLLKCRVKLLFRFFVETGNLDRCMKARFDCNMRLLGEKVFLLK